MTSVIRRSRVLVVDDAEMTLELLRGRLETEGYEVSTVTSTRAALEVLSNAPVDLLITDYRMPDGNGLELVRHVRENYRDSSIVMVTGYASIGGAVDAIKNGADEYLAKPFTRDELIGAVERALEARRLRVTPVSPSESAAPQPYGLVGCSPAIRQTYQAIRRAARSNATVLVTGESGTGKELVARAIHYASRRATGAFVSINCGSIPESLLGSELFGHVKGAFTGATTSRAGFFQAADGGTIFLDEVGDTSFAMQVQLLRTLQEGEVTMLGADRSRRVDVRVIAATNRPLARLVEQGAFREDLYFRLHVLSLDVPPLRERGDDVLLLARHFAGRFALEEGREAPDFSAEALRALKAHGWPGNVRELENVVRRAIVMSEEGTIDVSDLPPAMRYSLSSERPTLESLAAVEAEHIRRVLAAVEGNRSRAAKILGIDRKTLRARLQR